MTEHEEAGQSSIRVLFLCAHNSARSQMAEAILHHLRPNIQVLSAGTEAAPLQPLAVRAMKSHRIDISSQRSKNLSALAGQTFDYIITLCDGAQEECAELPGDPDHLHWRMPDPAAVAGDEKTRLRAYHEAARDLTARMRLFVALLDRDRA